MTKTKASRDQSRCRQEPATWAALVLDDEFHVSASDQQCPTLINAINNSPSSAYASLLLTYTHTFVTNTRTDAATLHNISQSIYYATT